MRGISNPTIKRNGETISIVPNSLSYKLGTGDKVIRAVSAGNNSIVPVVTDNAETKLGMIKFSVPNTSEGARLARQVADAGEGNEFQIIDEALQVSFSGMSLMTEPERPLSQDGVFELDFMGPQGVESA